MQYKIVTDSSCNLTDEMIDEFDLEILPLTFMSDGEQFKSYIKGQKSDLKSFFRMMREGKVFTTSLPNQEESLEALRAVLEGGNDLLYIGFSSGLSGTYQAIALLLESLKEEFPERKIYYTDTLAAAMGQGLIVYKAAKLAQAGAPIEEAWQWVEDNKLNCAHWFTVDDLMFLFRGGRVSRTSAWAGSLLKIKPVLHVDDEGKLIPMEKTRGRKKSLIALVDHMAETAIEPVSEQTVFISHGDCEDDAMFVAEEVKKRFGCTDVQVNCLDPVIGAHSGPGTVALFFMADHR